MVYLFLIGGLVLLAVFFAGRSRANEKQEMVRLVAEARLVREDLETLLAEVTCSAQEILDSLEEKINNAQELMQVPVARAVGGESPVPVYSGRGRREKVTPLSRKRETGKAETRLFGTGMANTCSGKIPPERYIQVYRMAEEGYTVKEIAEKSGLGQGEVKLILKLRYHHR